MTDDETPQPPIDIRTGKPIKSDDEKLAAMQKRYEELHPQFGDAILNYPAFAAFRDRIVRIKPTNNVISLAQHRKKKKLKPPAE